jgi:hypothetical protein
MEMLLCLFLMTLDKKYVTGFLQYQENYKIPRLFYTCINIKTINNLFGHLDSYKLGLNLN